MKGLGRVPASRGLAPSPSLLLLRFWGRTAALMGTSGKLPRLQSQGGPVMARSGGPATSESPSAPRRGGGGPWHPAPAGVTAKVPGEGEGPVHSRAHTGEAASRSVPGHLRALPPEHRDA